MPLCELAIAETDVGIKALSSLAKWAKSKACHCTNERESCTLHPHAIWHWVYRAATIGGELVLGKNVLIAYVPWENYNSEDAVLISECLVYEDI